MSNESRVLAGVPTGGQFAAQNRPESTVALAEAGWSPEPELATLIESPVGGEVNYHVALAEGGLRYFDFGHDNIEDNEYQLADGLEINRTDDQVTAALTFSNVDFTQAYPDKTPDEAGELLSENQEAIDAYLKETYGVIQDDTTDWDATILKAETDVTESCAADGDALSITTSNAVAAVYREHASLRRLCRELEGIGEDEGFYTALRRHLDSLA